MTQNLELVLLALCEMRSMGYITAARQLQMINMDMNPEYIRRECAMFLDKESETDVVPSGAKGIFDWGRALTNAIESGEGV